jgi:CelD/BcsL family acetyltransferase involved in cellulose biosynthesis
MTRVEYAGGATGATIVRAAGRNFAEHRLSSLFSSPEWIEVLVRTYGFETFVSTTVRENVRSAIFFSVIRDLRGDRIVCLPFSDYCDPLVDDSAVWSELVEPIRAMRLPITMRCLRNDLPTRDGPFHISKTAKWHGIDLTCTKAELWANLSGNARQNIQHAERSGVTVRIARTVDDVLTFHRMHAALRKKKYRLLAQPRRFFENLHEIFIRGNQSAVLFAEVDGSPLAGIFLLHWGDVAYYKFNASFDQRYRPNDLLTWHAMLYARQNGLRMLDFGLSDADQPGLLRYKRKFAKEEREIHFVEWVPENFHDPRTNSIQEVLRNLSRLFTEPSVPDEITLAAGEKFYHLFV